MSAENDLDLSHLRKADTETAIRQQFDDLTDPHTTSLQAVGDLDSDRHDDGHHIYKQFGIPPFHKYLARAERHGHAIAKFPSALLAPLLHVDERELELLEALTGEVEYDPDDPHPSHPMLREYPRLRGKVLEWVAADDGHRTGVKAAGKYTVDTLSDKGTDWQLYGPPNSGKTTLALYFALVSMQINNETVLWAETFDDSGTNDRSEWLALAPWTTLALPSDLPVTVRLVPYEASVAPFEVPLESLVRDVIRYDSPQDLNQQLMPGQFYVVFPDPHHNGCRQVSRHAYWGPEAITPPGEQGPDQATPANHWWFAYLASRITGDEYLHPTTIIADEAGNWIDPDARKDDHDSYQKCKWLAEKFADARKKGVSLGTMTHGIAELFTRFRVKQRWWVTMNGSAPPVNKTLPGDTTCPMEADYTSGMDPGEGQIWNANNYASISWPNLKQGVRLDAEVSIDFPTLGGRR
jgi:hypothetical protein